MPRMRKDNPDKSGLTVKPMYRHWLEIRDLKSNSIRTLPLTQMQRILLARKKGKPDRPPEQYLKLQDDSEIIEARDLDHLATQLRQKYPDDGYVRTLHSQRDPAAEERYARSLSSLMDLIVERMVLDFNEEADANAQS